MRRLTFLFLWGVLFALLMGCTPRNRTQQGVCEEPGSLRSSIDIIARRPVSIGESPFITGLVVDKMGSPIIGATAVLRGAKKEHRYSTSADIYGQFTFFNPPAGENLTLLVNAVACQEARLTDLLVTPEATLVLKVTLADSTGILPHTDNAQPTFLYKSTGSGAVITNWNERTGEPSVHPY